MNTSFYIAKRYLISKKSHNIINVISIVSVVGFTLGTTALIVVLSIFNGFESVVVQLFNTFNAEIQITPKEGKTFDVTTLREAEIRKIPGVAYLTDVIEESALLKYRDKQCVATIKGVNQAYSKMTGLDTMILKDENGNYCGGEFVLEQDSVDFMVVGFGVADNLGLYVDDFANPVEVYVPKKESSTLNLEDINSQTIVVTGIVSVQQEFDEKYVVVPLSFARKLLNYKNETSSVEIGLDPGADNEKIQTEIEKICGDKFLVKNRFQQQELLYKIMKTEKWAIICILSFILLVATFNIIGTLTMLILEKKKDIAVLWSMGADKALIRKIFFAEGMMITLLGAVLGLALGSFICWLQMQFGFITMPDDGTFVITEYPVEMRSPDFLLVLAIDIVIGAFVSWFPVRQISKRTIEQQKKF